MTNAIEAAVRTQQGEDGLFTYRVCIGTNKLSKPCVELTSAQSFESEAEAKQAGNEELAEFMRGHSPTQADN